MPSIEDLPAAVNAAEAVDIIAALADDLGLPGERPSLRTLRLWRSKQLLSRRGRQMTRRNLLEALGMMRLGAEGVATGVAAQQCRALDESRLIRLLTADQVGPALTSSGFARVTLQLLAQGILAQYRAVTERGAVVGHVDGARQQPPLALRQAVARLGRLFFEEGREETTASVNGLLMLAQRPLATWAPDAISGLPDVGSLILVDPYYRVPSEDCEMLAEEAEGTTLDDLIERHLHSELLRTLGKLGDEAEAAYTAIREFIARHPLATRGELHELIARPEWPDDAVAFVQGLYEPVHAARAQGGQVARCQFCAGLVEDRCCLRGCRDDHPQPHVGTRVPLAHALVARPEVLKYWVDPAREELRLYDSLRTVVPDVRLYPHTDRCDVSIGDEVGVDVKDYQEPLQLARRLNLSIGGLSHYARPILAVADRRAREGEYLARLKEQLTPANRHRLEIRTVTDAIRVLRRDFGRKGSVHVRQA